RQIAARRGRSATRGRRPAAERSGSPLPQGAQSPSSDRLETGVPLDRFEPGCAYVSANLLNRTSPGAKNSRIDGGHRVDIIRADSQRTLRELRSIKLPI